MNVVQRARDILLKPKTEWAVIEGEASDIAGLYKQYLMILAAIPAVASFVGMSFIGIGVLGMSMRVPVTSGLLTMVVSYVVSLAACAVLALIVDALASTFGGQKNRINAFKLVVYGSTAAMVGGVFSLIPALWMLGVIASLYSIYLVYLGLPVLMKCPAEKAATYTAAVIGAGIVLGIVMAGVNSALTPVRSGGMFGGVAPADQSDAAVTFSTPQGSLRIDPNDGGSLTIQSEEGTVSVNTAEIEEMSKRMLELSNELQAAQQAGNQAEVERLGEEMQELGERADRALRENSNAE